MLFDSVIPLIFDDLINKKDLYLNFGTGMLFTESWKIENSQINNHRELVK